MKPIIPLLVIAGSLLFLPACDQHQDPPAAPQPAPLKPKPAAQPPALPAKTTPTAAYTPTGPFESLTEIWRLIPTDTKPPEGERFSPEQRTDANRIFTQAAVGKTARILLPEITVDRTPKGPYQGKIRIRSNPPSDIAKVNFYAYFDTADEKTALDLLDLRPKTTVVVEGIITRCNLSQGTRGPDFNIDMRECKVIPRQDTPALTTQPARANQPQ